MHRSDSTFIVNDYVFIAWLFNDNKTKDIDATNRQQNGSQVNIIARA